MARRRPYLVTPRSLWDHRAHAGDAGIASTLPYMLTGMRIAMGVSFASIIVAEMVSADAGLGYLLSYSMTISATDMQFVTILCLGGLGFATDKVFQLLARAAFGRFV